MSEGIWPCVVCGEPAEPEARSDCYRCGEFFHLRLTTTATGPDCGDVWIDDEVMALQFACRNCLAEQAGELTPEVDEPPAAESTPQPSKPPSAQSEWRRDGPRSRASAALRCLVSDREDDGGAPARRLRLHR